jgi:membrane protein required for colicin V production
LNFSFNQFDIVLCLIILILMIRGTIKGFIAEVLSMAAVILGIGLAVIFSGMLSKVVTSIFGESIWSPVIAFLGIFIIVYLIVKLLEGAIHKGIEKLNLHKLDRVMGFLLGFIEGILVISCIVLIIRIQPFVDADEMITGSIFARIILPVLIPAAAAVITGNEGI